MTIVCPIAPADRSACSDEEARYLALLESVRAAQPTRCPRCGSDAICPDFDVLDCWTCAWCRRDFVPNA